MEVWICILVLMRTQPPASPTQTIEPGAHASQPGLAASLAVVVGPWVLAFVFAAAGFAKALNPEAIGETMGLLVGGLLGGLFGGQSGGEWAASGWFVGTLVLAEVLLAAWLVSGWRPRLALATAIASLVIFSASLAALLIVEPTSPCGCGLPALSGNTAVDNGLGIARNVILIIIAAVAWPPRGCVGSMEEPITLDPSKKEIRS